MEGVQNLPKSRKNPQNQAKYANICTKESKNTQKLSAFCRFCYIIVPRKARLARECGHRLHFCSSHLSFLCSFYIDFVLHRFRTAHSCVIHSGAYLYKRLQNGCENLDFPNAMLFFVLLCYGVCWVFYISCQSKCITFSRKGDKKCYKPR